MTYTQSPLATCEMWSPHYSNDRITIDRITIHHTATGAISGKRIGEIFQNPSRDASCSYGIGNDGSICAIVRECHRAWTSSNRTNDRHAITFEVSNSAYGEPWPISEEALESTVALIVDICKRYGKNEVISIDDEIRKLPQNQRANYANNYVVPEGKILLTQHNYFWSTACPGTTFKNLWGAIVKECNKRIGNAEPTPTPIEPKKEEFIEYNVVKGDTLTKIAKQFNTTIDTIVKDNNIKNKNLIYVNQKLKIRKEN